ncbi:MAG: phenylalanine--tRNA ligase subunit beta, partial [Clostridia bacterium]|nr:phenylalanine--tRNA ligase subunit beta [Clostridia bacterium]
NRALHLVEELGCGTPTAYRTDVNSADLTPKTITTTFAKINSLLGIEVPQKEVDAILTRLGFTVKAKGDTLSVTVPLWREDVDGYPDLAEEVIRSYGYEHITPTFLSKATVTHGGLTRAQKQELKFKNTLKAEGFMEACNYSFGSPKDFDLLRLPANAPERKAVAIRNPIGEDLSVMRTTLAATMLQNIVRNVRRGNDSGRLFEVANVYLADRLPLETLPEERKTCVLGLWGEGDFFDMKGAVEAIGEAFDLNLVFERGEKPFLHSGKTAIVKLGEKTVGYLGELHPAIANELALEKPAYLCELDYAALAKKFAKDIAYTNLPKFPSVQRDLAVVVNEDVTCAELTACILHACKAVKKAELFDVYRSESLGLHKKSMAFRLTFVPEEKAEKPLSPETVDGFFNKILGNLKHNLDAQLR